MARKRKSEAAAGIDEADRALYSAFSGAANSISHLYTQSMSLQKQAFRDGELHALEKLSQWMLRKHAEESRLEVADIMAHIQHEMGYGVDYAQFAPSAGKFANSSYNQPSATSYSQATGLASRAINGGAGEQSKSTAMFSNTLSSPVWQRYQHLTQGGRAFGNGGRNTPKANSDANLYDTMMD